ncbi:hypothetical protein [Edaphobacter aggregans]|uniref:hypothetical protein n=1 Tax=Edaphobacter aggregans TaxID=570835 RepID=UPI001FDFB6C5|nr:hypothetical protein [Edaphobacter aggregans]
MGEFDGIPLILLCQLKFVCKCIALFLYGAQRLRYSEFPLDFSGVKLGLQFLNLSVLSRGILLRFAGSPCFGEFDGVLFILFSQLKALVQLALEVAVSHLLQNVRVPSLVNLECFPAVRAANFMHVHLPVPISVITKCGYQPCFRESSSGSSGHQLSGITDKPLRLP